MRILVKILLILTFSLTAIAEDGGQSEAQFKNNSKQDLYCYGDVGGTDYICQVKVGPGESCSGDAIGGEFGSKVFKAPNKTRWDCKLNEKNEIACDAQNVKSSLLTIAATAYHRFKGYYTHQWKDFVDIMGQKSFRKCNKENKPISNEVWVPMGDERKCDLKKE